MSTDIRQLERALAALSRDNELKRVADEEAKIESEIQKLQAKLSEWSEKRREREARIVEEKHDLERQIEEAKRAMNLPK